MHDDEDQHMPDVSTEPQRQALDAMSQQLVANLNAMVHEQHERARRFAATQHSLSPLPQQPELEQPQLSDPTPGPTYTQEPVWEPAEAIPPLPVLPQPAPRAKKKGYSTPPPRPTERKMPQDFAAPALSGSLLTPFAKKKDGAQKAQKKEEESGCSATTIIIFIIFVFIIIRGCSS